METFFCVFKNVIYYDNVYNVLCILMKNIILKKVALSLLFFLLWLSLVFAKDDIDLWTSIDYSIVSWDTLSSIALSYNIPEQFLRNYNNIDADEQIVWNSLLTLSKKKIDHLLIIPLWGSIVENTKKQTLSSFSKQYDLNVNDLLVVNNFSADNLIAPGIEIFLPYYDITKNKNEWGIARLQKNGWVQVDLSSLSRSKATMVLDSIDHLYYDDIDYDAWTVIESWHQKGKWNWWFAAWFCTDYAAFRRPDLFSSSNGTDRPFGWDAKDRYTNADKAWIPVWKLPKKWAIAVFAPGRGGHKVYGHVAIVEKVGKNDTIEITDMNYKWLNIVTRRIISSKLPVGYIY